MSTIRVNILALAAIGALLLAGVALVVDDHTAVLAAVGAYVGGLASIGNKLAEPDNEPTVPASVALKAIEKGKGCEKC